MKKTILFFFLIFIFTSLFSQDLIVTFKGDSINCKILQITQDHILYSIKYNNQSHKENLPLIEVKQFESNYYSYDDNYFKDLIVTLNNDSIRCKILQTDKNKIYYTIQDNKEQRYDNILLSGVLYYTPQKIEHPKLRIAFNGGFSYLTSKLSSDISGELKNYYNKLRKGYNFGIDIIYYSDKSYGFGGKASLFKTSSNTYLSLDNSYPSYYSEDITHLFVGPAFSARIPHGAQNNSFFLNASLGYMGYFNRVSYIQSVKMRGNTFGACIDIGYDLGISENVMLGIEVSYFLGSIAEFKVISGKDKIAMDLKNGQREGLNRLDICIGIRFR